MLKLFSMLNSIPFLIIGFAALIYGANWLVDGASSVAKRAGIAPIVIGLTIVAFGTSMPELVVNVVSVLGGNPEIAIGNIIGSNIANILLILGIAGCIAPLTVIKNTTWKEIPLALLASILVYVMASDLSLGTGVTNTLDRIDGIILISFFIIFLYYTHGISKNGSNETNVKLFSKLKSWLMIIGGLGLLVLGGKLAVDGAVGIATMFGVSERVIALTVIAVGTSLPELLTSAIAAYKKHSDIAIGNVVGSNIFNVFWILGISSILKPLPFSTANNTDILVSVSASVLLFLAMFVGRKHKLERWQAAGFIILYAGYIVWLIVS